MSSIARAEQAALSLSKPSLPPLAVAAATPVEAVDGSKAGTQPATEAHTPALGAVKLVTVENMQESVQRLLVATPAYPSGIGGRLASSLPTDAPSPKTVASTRSYSVVFDDAGEPGRSAVTAGGRLPPGLEAVCNDDSGMLCVREVLLPDSNGTAVAADTGGVIARIEALPTVAGGREAGYSVWLDGAGRGKELMAVRVTTHPTRLAAPREIRAVFLSPGLKRETTGRRKEEQENSGCVSVLLEF